MNSPLLQVVGSKQHAGTHHDIDLSDSLAHKSAPCASCDLLSSAEGSPTSAGSPWDLGCHWMSAWNCAVVCSTRSISGRLAGSASQH